MSEKLTCVRVQAGEGGSYTGKQAFTYDAGLYAENTGAQAICMHMVNIPPGGKAKAHMHENHETAIYVISGVTEMWYGENMDQHMVIKAGEFLYIPAGMPHLPYNPSETEVATAVIARTDPNEQESVVLLPHLER